MLRHFGTRRTRARGWYFSLSVKFVTLFELIVPADPGLHQRPDGEGSERVDEGDGEDELEIENCGQKALWLANVYLQK
jgi:hypothetical protein